jgi:hypothetical protein
MERGEGYGKRIDKFYHRRMSTLNIIALFILITSFHTKPNENKIVVVNSIHNNDSTPVAPKRSNPDSAIKISIINFDRTVDKSIQLLETKNLADISDAAHIDIMRCLNTIFMRDLKGGHYEQLRILGEKKYVMEITKLYKEWCPNRGMGFYFYKLDMELYGTPSPYAIYKIMGL